MFSRIGTTSVVRAIRSQCPLSYTLSLCVHTVPRRVPSVPIEIIFALLEAGYYIHDLRQDTQFLLSASLVCKSWSRPAQALLFRHVVIRSQAAFATLCDALSSSRVRGMDLARRVRSLSATLDPEQPGCLQPLSFARVISLLPNLKTLDLVCYPRSKPTPPYHQRDSKPHIILEDEEVSMMMTTTTTTTTRSGPVITTLRLTNWSDDRSLLDKLLSLYRSSLRTLSLRGMPSSFSPSPTLTTPHHPLNLTLEPPLTPTLLDWLTHPTPTPTIHPHVRVHALEFTRQPEHTVLAALLTAQGDTLAALALPTLTTADAALLDTCTCTRLRSLRTEHPYAALPPLRVRLRHAALAPGPALALVRREMRARRDDGAGSSGCERLERLSVMVWSVHDRELGEESVVVRALKLACAQLGIRVEFERDFKAFRALFWAGIVEHK